MSRFITVLRASKLALAALLALTACGGGGSNGTPGAGPPPPSQPPPAASGSLAGSLAGSIVALDSDAIVSNAVVRTSEKTANADAAGRFELKELAPADRVLVRVSAPGYLDAFVRADVVANATTRIRPRLVPASAPLTIDARSDNVITLPNSAAQVRLPANSLVDANGAAVTGPVRVGLTPIDPAAEPDSMPGGYLARIDGAARPIESFGAIKVDLRDADGNRLNLAQGRTATIRIPLATRSGNPPATVPLFYFDETAGLWMKEGTATLSGEGAARFYEGAVSHFTYWNADRDFDAIRIRGCVRDQFGRVAERVTVISSGIDYSGVSTSRTDGLGMFEVSARPNSTVVLYGETRDGITHVERIVTGDKDIDMGRCMDIHRIPPRQRPDQDDTAPIPPVIVGQPVNQSVTVGDFAAFNVAVVGSPVLQYQWRRNGVDVPGANQRTLFVAPATLDDHNAEFSVVVSNSVGSATSGGARLEVTAAPQAPSFVQQPQAAAIYEGETATFTVVARGSDPLTFRWRRDGVEVGSGAGSSYTTPAAALTDDGAMFSVTVSNGFGEITSQPARLTVSAGGAPRIDTQPASLNVPEGSPAVFVVQASGGAALNYRWQRNGIDVPGGNQPTLLVPMTSAADNGAVFRVIIGNENGSVTSTAATLHVTRGSAEQQQRILRLAHLWTDVLNAVAAPVDLLDENLRLIAAPCSGGAVTVSVDGAPVSSGTQLPTGTHRLGASFDACRVANSLSSYLGESRVDYTLQSAQKRAGTFVGSTNGFRIYRDAGADGEVDVQVTASGRFEGVVTPRSPQVDERGTFTPDAGSTVFSLGTQRTAAFAGGSVVLDSTYPEQDPSAVQRVRTTYQALAFRIDDVLYELQGFYEFEYASESIAGGSGEVTITAGGRPIGRVFATSAGIAADALTELQSF